MNSSGWIRSRIAESYGNEAFLLFVGNTIEHQLQEWDEDYAVNIMKFKDYHFVVKNGETYYETVIKESELPSLQAESPYALDAKIWDELQQDGLRIIKGYGNYLRKVFMSKDSEV